MDADEPNIDATELRKWQDTITLSDSEISNNEELPNRSPFRYDEVINKKIAYWIGNIWSLKADAIVCCNNETFTLKTDLITRNTLSCAGRDLVFELRNIIKYCRTSEAVVTSGYNLPSSRVIHIVGPKYSDKYATAAESALHNAYRNVLNQARDNNIRTLAIRCIHSSVFKYPSLAGAHVALRTIRRFLERHRDNFDLIVLAVSNHNKEAYDNLLPLYFPRSSSEEILASGRLPKNVGDECGQLFIPERQIRISAAPHYYQITHDNGDDSDGGGDDDDDGNGRDSKELSNGHLEEEDHIRNLHITDPSFLEMRESVDKERIKRILRGNNYNDALLRKQFYKRILIRAMKEDFSDLIKKRFLFHCGYDREMRPVMLFIAHRWHLMMQETNLFSSKSLPNLNKRGDGIFARYFRGDDPSITDKADEMSERYRLFFIHQMEALVKENYVILYVQSLCDKAGSLPSTKCLQSLLGMLDARYISRLHALYILHSTFTNKIRCWFKLPSILYQKTIFLKGVEHLYSLISPDEVEMPEFVLAHDLDLYGVRYYEGEN